MADESVRVEVDQPPLEGVLVALREAWRGRSLRSAFVEWRRKALQLNGMMPDSR